MKYIPMNVLEYRFDEQGVTQLIVVAFQDYDSNEQFNARISLDSDYVKSINENLDLDRLSKAQVENFARRKLRDWINTPRPEETEEETTEETVEASEE